uniref:General transcription factor IIE subunit 1 n=1 Tax=Ciona savignyi TaxID=51511 RepID=H2ZEG5_CIOSA
MMEHSDEVLREVPDALQRLIRRTVRGFCGKEPGLAIDMLVRNPCMKEDDMQELLKFEKKQLRSILTQLKNDKFIKSRTYVEQQEDGKVARHNYYYINYRSVANVIKYKLHHIHKRIETRERDSNNRPSFKCPTCQNTYSDLDVNHLFDPIMGTLNCSFCKTEVEEEASASNTTDRNSQARFNRQMEPLYELMKDVENITLSEDILNPKPTVIPQLHPNEQDSHRAERSRTRTGEKWTPRNKGDQQNVVIDMGEEVKVEKKEMPLWLTESTIPGAAVQPSTFESNKVPRLEEAKSNPTNDEVLQTLIVQERSSKPSAPAPTYPDSDESDDFEDVDDLDSTIVMVAGKPYSYKDVAHQATALVQLMTEDEKAAYIKIGQQMYEAMD